MCFSASCGLLNSQLDSSAFGLFSAHRVMPCTSHCNTQGIIIIIVVILFCFLCTWARWWWFSTCNVVEILFSKILKENFIEKPSRGASKQLEIQWSTFTWLDFLKKLLFFCSPELLLYPPFRDAHTTDFANLSSERQILGESEIRSHLCSSTPGVTSSRSLTDSEYLRTV